LTIGAAYRRFAPRLLIGIALLGLALGGWFWWRGEPGSSHLAWTLGTLPVLVTLFGQIIASLRRDVVAVSFGAGSRVISLWSGTPRRS
jgi:hypothetical protein